MVGRADTTTITYVRIVMPNTRECSKCIHSIRAGHLRKNPSDLFFSYVVYEGVTRCTYEPKWVTVDPKHFCEHFQLDTTQGEMLPFERYIAPTEYREDVSESIQ